MVNDHLFWVFLYFQEVSYSSLQLLIAENTWRSYLIIFFLLFLPFLVCAMKCLQSVELVRLSPRCYFYVLYSWINEFCRRHRNTHFEAPHSRDMGPQKFNSLRFKLKKVKVKQSHYRPGQALRVPGGWGSHISRQSTHEGWKVFGPTHRPPLPPKKYSWCSFLLGWINPWATVRPEGLCQWKIPVTQ
jgi:hypothetical protein